jgi:hypothetical protein
VVRDLDKFELLQQAYEYETSSGIDLSEFYLNVPPFKSVEVKAWADELL